MGQVLIRALLPFDDVRAGDEAWVDDTPRTRALAGRGFVAVLATEPPAQVSGDPVASGVENADGEEDAEDGPADPEHP